MTDRIDCAQQCEIPDGIQLVEVPRPRHAWGDVFNCPNDGCGRSFMQRQDDGPSIAECAEADAKHWAERHWTDSADA